MGLALVTPYNQMLDVLAGDANRQWDNATAGSNMFVLVTAAYTPDPTHTTAANFGANIITAGAGAPINVPTPAINNLAGVTWFTSGNADFGSAVSITAKYLACIQPVTAGTYAATAKLLWYEDLEDLGGSLSSSASPFVIQPSTNGWLSITPI